MSGAKTRSGTTRPADLLAWFDDGVLIIDGASYERLPRGAQWAGRTVYMVDGSIAEVARWYGMRGDRVSGPRPPYVQSMDVRCGGGFWSLRGRDVWGLPGDKGDPTVRTRAAAVLEEMRLAVEEEGYDWRPTASGVAKRMGRDILSWLGDKSSRLGERYHELAMAAVTPGPMLVTRANNGERALQLDKKGAFLEGIREARAHLSHAPVRPFHPWAEVRRREGIVCAAARIPEGLYVGPLPVRRAMVTAWPVGVVAGCWTIDALKRAEGLGVEVMAVLDGFVGTGPRQRLRPLAERFDRIEHPGLRKAMYTRWWSRWASVGWSVAEIDAHDPVKGVRFDLLPWTRRPPWYAERRPDVSADIAARAWGPVVDLMLSHGRDVVAAHVDAVWTRRVSEVPEGFSLKGDGPTRFWSIGTYEAAGKVAAMGCPPHVRGREAVRRWAESGSPAGTALSREWRGMLLPSRNPSAESDPVRASLWGDWRLPFRPTFARDGDRRPTLSDLMGADLTSREPPRPRPTYDDLVPDDDPNKI